MLERTHEVALQRGFLIVPVRANAIQKKYAHLVIIHYFNTGFEIDIYETREGRLSRDEKSGERYFQFLQQVLFQGQGRAYVGVLLSEFDLNSFLYRFRRC